MFDQQKLIVHCCNYYFLYHAAKCQETGLAFYLSTLGEYEPMKPPVKSDFNKANVTRYETFTCKKQFNCTMDDSPFRQTFELGIFISTAEKSILNLVK